MVKIATVNTLLYVHVFLGIQWSQFHWIREQIAFSLCVFFTPVLRDLLGCIAFIFFTKQAIFMIPTKPPPTFRDPEKWSQEFIDFTSKCLIKNPEERATATDLLQVSRNMWKWSGLEGLQLGIDHIMFQVWNGLVLTCLDFTSKCLLNPNQPWGGGAASAPLKNFRDKSAARIGLAARFHEFFLYRFAHILRPNLWHPGVRLQSYVTFSTCMSARKLLNFVYKSNANWDFRSNSYNCDYFNLQPH